ncbi:uncharacterized protein LOC122507833 isoform X2 [Leptopilina heterotoma]|uniref:uncharacterized protein LOC122507833 isoform X2 n=1 Tax=Leptopilina heterotoma TaxID=63436 RepID=UPI001CA88645|nr:uncharacterized protein LOC122507833 isoform X2 [Leptopilina heterotoma]
MQFSQLYELILRLMIIIIASDSAVGIDHTLEFQDNVPMKSVWADKGDNVELPCDISPPTPGDTISMVLWFKDNDGIPIYSIDARKGNLRSAVHWAVSNDLGKKTYFQMTDGHRGKLKLNNVEFIDQGIFRCRVDFVNSPTRNFRVNLTLIENPSNPVIYDERGIEVRGISGPFLEGYNLLLICKVFGGRPKPSVTWWQDVTKSLWGTKLECRAQSGEIGKPVIKEVPLDVYLKPAVVKIFFSEDPVLEGREITARCQTWGSSPAARIIWKLGGLEIGGVNIITTQMSNSTISKIDIVLSKDDDEKDITCRAENPRFPGGILEETRTVHVLQEILLGPRGLDYEEEVDCWVTARHLLTRERFPYQDSLFSESDLEEIRRSIGQAVPIRLSPEEEIFLPRVESPEPAPREDWALRPQSTPNNLPEAGPSLHGPQPALKKSLAQNPTYPRINKPKYWGVDKARRGICGKCHQPGHGYLSCPRLSEQKPTTNYPNHSAN